MTLQIRIKLLFEYLLPFEGNLWFNGKPPISIEEGIKYEFENEYIVYIYFNEGINEYTRGLKTYENGSSDTIVRDLTLIIEKQNPDNRLIEYIKKREFKLNDVETPGFFLYNVFLLESTRIYRKTHDLMTSYIRNIKRQYWLKHLSNPIQYFEERELDIQFIIDGEVIPLQGSLSYRGDRPSIIDEDLRQFPITSEDLREVENIFQQRGWKPSMYLVLITDSFQYFTENRPREALILAVIALENAIYVFFPRIMKTIEGGEKVLGLIKKRGLAKVVKKGLELLEIETIYQNCALCIDAIAERNKIIHKAKRDLDLNQIRDYILVIHDIIQTLWEYDQTIE